MKIRILEMWQAGGAQRLLIVIFAVSFVALLLIFMASIGLIVLDWRVRAMWRQNIRMEQSISSNTEKLHKNQEQIKEAEQRIMAEANQRWLTFQYGNPELSVPLVNPRNKEIDVKPPISTPTPPAPRVIIKKQTVIIHRKAPTPKPWWRPK